MVKLSIIDFETFEDLVYFLVTRMSTVSPSISALCMEDKCFTILSGGNEVIFVLRSPAPQNRTRFVYVDDNGKVVYSRTPVPGKPMVFVVNVKNVREVESLVEALK